MNAARSPASAPRSSRTGSEAFDPAVGGVPEDVEALFGRSPEERSAVLLVAGPRARASGWAAMSAAALAERLASGGRRVVLCDLSVESPELHRLLRTSNLEGMADIFLFGASLKRVVTRAGERGINFVPAGPAVPDAAAILDHPRWGRMLSGAAEARATLLLYVPAGTRGADALAERVGRAVLLAHPEEADAVESGLPDGCSARAVLVPAPTRDPAPVRPGADPVAEEDIPGFALAGGGGVFSSRRYRRGGPRVLAWLLILLLVVAGGWLMARILGARTLAFGLLPEVIGSQAEQPVAPAGAPSAIEEPLPYSVAIEAHQDLGVALERARSLEESNDETGFFVSPILLDEVLYYRVMAGPVAQDSAARQVMRMLVERGDKREASDWDVRPTGLAFRIGEFADPARAEARRAELGAAGIPAYIVVIPYTRGPSRYRIYAGAYETPEQAEPLTRMLREAGIQSPLIERTGQPPA